MFFFCRNVLKLGKKYDKMRTQKGKLPTYKTGYHRVIGENEQGKQYVVGCSLNERKNEKIMCKASELAKYTINECLNRGYEIDTPKVQKLLTLMHGEYLAKYGQPLFPEDVEVWECGVAIRKVNNDFKSYLFGITEKQTCYLAILDNEIFVINSVIEKYGMKDVFEISEDPRLRYIKDYFFEKKPIAVPNDFIKKVFMENECPY